MTYVRLTPAKGVLSTYTNNCIVLLTVCSKNRRPILTESRIYGHLISLWQDSSYWVVGRYVVLPDHLHVFASPKENCLSIEKWVAYWKSIVSKNYKKDAQACLAVALAKAEARPNRC